MFCATTHGADAIAQEMKKAVHGMRFFGAASTAPLCSGGQSISQAVAAKQGS